MAENQLSKRSVATNAASCYLVDTKKTCCRCWCYHRQQLHCITDNNGLDLMQVMTPLIAGDNTCNGGIAGDNTCNGGWWRSLRFNSGRHHILREKRRPMNQLSNGASQQSLVPVVWPTPKKICPA
jgi:hypothetical protein